MSFVYIMSYCIKFPVDNPRYSSDCLLSVMFWFIVWVVTQQMSPLFNSREDSTESWATPAHKKQQAANSPMCQQTFWLRNFTSIIFFMCIILLNHNHKKSQGKIFIYFFVQYFSSVLIFSHRKYKLDIKESRRSVSKMRMATEVCKHTLSTLENAQVSIDSLHEGVDFHSSVSRQVESPTK